LKQNTQVFLIDDDIDDQDFFCMAIGDIDKSIECTIAEDGVEALKILTGNHNFIPDYIFIDVNMPRMNGLACLKEVKALHHLNDAKVIMYSTTSEQKILDQSKAFGAYDFIIKPGSLTMLTEKLSKILASSKENF
jgi:CheY-like chemotaxis protein